MPTEVLAQLRALRNSIAETLRKDPRYLTLAALDRSIAEISSVLNEAAVSSTDSSPDPAVSPETERTEEATEPPAEEPPQPEEDPAEQIVDVHGGPAETGAADALESSVLSPGDSGDETVPAADEARPEDTPDAVHAPARTSSDGDPADQEAFDSLALVARTTGYTPMQPSAEATRYQPAMSVKFGKLPNKVDLRPLMYPVDDQGEVRCCVANAVSSAYEYWIRKASKQEHRVSRLYVYYNARWRDGTEDLDDGSAIQFTLEGLARFGACSEGLWPFDPDLVPSRPSTNAYEEGVLNLTQDMAQVPLKLDAWKQALAEGKPIIFGCAIFESFHQCSTRGGVVPMPAPSEIGAFDHALHCMCAVGYSERERVFVVRNCWGSGWGDEGYCYIPFDYLMSPTFNDGDCWIFIPKVPSQPPREAWSDAKAPVTNGGRGVDFEIAPYIAADYASVGVDLFEAVRRPFNVASPQEYADHLALARSGSWQDAMGFDRRLAQAVDDGVRKLHGDVHVDAADRIGAEYDFARRERWQRL